MKFIFDIQRFDSYWNINEGNYAYCTGYPSIIATNSTPDTWTDYGTMKKGIRTHSSSTTTPPSLKKYVNGHRPSDTGSTTTLHNCTLTYIAEGVNFFSDVSASIELNGIFVSGFGNPSTNYSKYVELGGTWQMLSCADFSPASNTSSGKAETESRIYKLQYQNVYFDVATTTDIKNELLSHLKNIFTSTDKIVKFLGKDHFPYYHNTITGTNDANGIKTYYRTTFNYSGTNGNVVNYVANIIKKFIIKI